MFITRINCHQSKPWTLYKKGVMYSSCPPFAVTSITRHVAAEVLVMYMAWMIANMSVGKINIEFQAEISFPP